MMILSQEIRIVHLVLDVLIFVLACWRLHSLELLTRKFFFWLGIMVAFGWLVIADIDYYVGAIDLMDYRIPGLRTIIFKLIMLTAVTYAVIVGDCRNKCKS